MAGSQDYPTATTTRALAAIMFSDVANYTLIMGRDERKGLALVDAHRALLNRTLPKFGGRIVGEARDGTLSSFSSAVDAVNCAREIQASLRGEPEISIRIGIHVGDVVFAEGNVLGDGVSVASRIHALAPPGGICISGRVYDDVRNQPGIELSDLGEKRLKNVEKPV